MPDWTYRTIFRRPLFALPFRTARWLAFSGLGTLAKIPGGSLVIDFFGHTTPPRDLTVVVDGVEYCSPVGLGPRLDPQWQALPALARFGVGWVEVEPFFRLLDRHADISTSPIQETVQWCVGCLEESSWNPPFPPALPVASWARVSGPHKDKSCSMFVIELARRGVAAITLDALPWATDPLSDAHTWATQLDEVVRACDNAGQSLPMYLVIPIQGRTADCCEYLSAALAVGIRGFVIVNLELESPPPATDQLKGCCEQIRELRNLFGPNITLVAAAGVHSPEDAIECWRAGATLVQVDTGMVFAGPGLPKRINEARRFYQSQRDTSLRSAEARQEPRPPDSRPLTPDSRTSTPEPRPAPSPLPRSVEQAWFWLLLLGLSMGGGGMIAWAIAATRVVLPYDEAYLEMTREQIAAINPRLLLFMTHDRITLAGTMLAVGVFYSFLAWHAVRRGSHWAWLTILASALSGFASFFLFLFFGYFDPFHALVTSILFQLLLAGWQGKLASPALPHYPNLRETFAWKLAQWGQLLFVAHGAALIVGGTVICYVGSTTVFVHEDLEFMRTTRDELLGLHPRLIPVVAHDRASFGGMLIANGLATLLSALWGFRQGDGWQWWMYALSGTLAYGSTLIVHYSVGYSSLMHLAPAFVGMLGVVIGLGLSYPYLMGIDVEHYKRWKELLK